MTKSKTLTFWDRLKIAKKHRLKAEAIMKNNGITFLQELCGLSKNKFNLRNIEKLMGYLHYEAGLTLHQIQNDMGLMERHVRSYNQSLLEKIGARESNTPTTAPNS